jgi:hypothetical protein
MNHDHPQENPLEPAGRDKLRGEGAERLIPAFVDLKIARRYVEMKFASQERYNDSTLPR